MQTQKIIFLAGEDTYILSHRLPAARAAIRAGYEVHIVAQDTGKGQDISNLGFVFHPRDGDRKDRGPLALVKSILQIRSLLKNEEPHILHNIGIQFILVGMLATIGLRLQHIYNNVNGIGFMFTSSKASQTVARALFTYLLRFLNKFHDVTYLFQNGPDHALFTQLRISPVTSPVIKGSGVDINHYKPAPLPIAPLTIGSACRMIGIKGVRDLITAVKMHNPSEVRLKLAGLPDSGNPSSLKPDELEGLAIDEQIEWLGHVDDMFEFWSGCHVGALMSHGGEGVPMALLQPAAMARPILTTNVPGNHSLVWKEENGFTVPAGDPDAIATAITKLLNADLQKMGQRSHAHIISAEFSSAAVEDALFSIYSAGHDSATPAVISKSE